MHCTSTICQRPSEVYAACSQIRRAHHILALLLGTLALALPIRAQGLGAWTGPYDWSSCLATAAGCTSLSELSHAALIPTGPYRGKVLMWREQYTATCDPAFTTEAWIFDPFNPATLMRVEYLLDSNIFCGGASWDPEGELVVCGGDRNTAVLLASYRFRPQVLSPYTVPGACGPYIPTRPSNPPWFVLDDTHNSHYYPGILALTKKSIVFNGSCTGASGSCNSILGGAHLLLGGPVWDGTPGQNVMEFLPYRGSTWRSVSNLTTPIHWPGSNASTANDRYSLRSVGTDPAPSDRLDSYPRAFQLSSNDILIAFDLDTAAGTQPNLPAEWWVMRPYGGYGLYPERFQPWRGSLAGGQPNFDRNYAPAILMHQASDPATAVLDRVLVFAGANFTSTTKTVQEFTPAATFGQEGPVVSGSWNPKADLQIARNFSVGLPLPDGHILITQGTSDPAPLTANAIVQPELYNPGRFPADASSSTLMSPSNTVGSTNLRTSRTYHHVAVLLPDGRVFIAGGEAASAGFANGQYSGEIFEPPYLSWGINVGYIQSTDTRVPLNPLGSTTNKFKVVVADVDPSLPIERVVLTRPAAVTHGFDTDQRYIELPWSIAGSAGGVVELHVTAPQENLAPPGYYMLWIVVSDGGTPARRIPTTAEFVQFY